MKNISDDLKKKIQKLNGKKLQDLEHKLIHHYFGLDRDIVWNVIKTKIPEIKESLE